MGCFSDREKGQLEESQKWAYVTLSDFTASGALAYFSYAWLWFLAIVAVAVYGADTFTAVNLLAYDKWSSEIEPAIPLEYSKWIFAACIFVSWALCAFEWVRAIRVIRRGSVAESYMDPLAVTLQSMRPQGWKRFLLFAELTKSKKGVDYIALFVYFSLKGALRIILAEAPRQVINGITLYSVMKADIVPTGSQAAASGHSSIEQFFLNIGTLAETNREQTVVLFTMLFTLSIWVISALSLIAAVVLYLVFLWHYVPQKDGRLSIYCRRKIDRRLSKIVGAKVKQALEDQEKRRVRAEAKDTKDAQLAGRPMAKRQPTIPQIARKAINSDKVPQPGLERHDSEATLPLYSAHPPTMQYDDPTLPNRAALSRQPILPDIQTVETRPGLPSRSGTNVSAMSFASDAPLLDNATEMGYEDHSNFPLPPRPVMTRNLPGSYHGSRTDDNRGPAAVSGARPILHSQPSATSHGSSPYLDRYTSVSSSRPLPESQMSASHSRPLPPNGQAPTGAYGPRPWPNRQFSAPSYMSQAPSSIRSMQPLREASSQTLALQSEPGFGMYEDIGTQEHDKYTTSSTTSTFEGSGHAGYLSYEYDQIYSTPATTGHVTSQAGFAPTHGAQGRRGSDESMASYNDALAGRRGLAPTYARSFNASPAPSGQAFEMTAQHRPNGAYAAFNPMHSEGSAAASRLGHGQRSVESPTRAVQPPPPGLQRSVTAPPEAGLYLDLIDDYKRGEVVGVPTRSATAGPGRHEQW